LKWQTSLQGFATGKPRTEVCYHACNHRHSRRVRARRARSTRHDTQIDLPNGQTYYLSPGADHVGTDERQVWEETNNYPGLQKVAFEDEDGRIIPADDRVQ